MENKFGALHARIRELADGTRTCTEIANEIGCALSTVTSLAGKEKWRQTGRVKPSVSRSTYPQGYIKRRVIELCNGHRTIIDICRITGFSRKQVENCAFNYDLYRSGLLKRIRNKEAEHESD